MRRWISCVRPETGLFPLSRLTLVFVEEGRREYSAVTHPDGVSIHFGDFSSTVAVTITFVSPHSTRTEPEACFVKWRVNFIFLSSSFFRFTLIYLLPFCLFFYTLKYITNIVFL